MPAFRTYPSSMLRAAVLPLLLAACAPAGVVDGRPYDLRVPNSGSGPRPLIVLLHGFSANAQLQDLLLPFSRDVDSRGFLYALPNGTLDHEGKRFWNTLGACCNFDHAAVDDVAFLRKVIADVKANHAVDPKRVFVIGHSNGGFMALRLACDAPDIVAAVVSLAGAASTPCPSGRPVDVLTIHGTEDDTIAFNGGSTELGTYPSAAKTIAQLGASNGCSGSLTPAGTSDFLGDAAEETKRAATEGCPPRGRADLWTVEGAGHVPIFNDAFRTSVLDWLGL